MSGRLTENALRAVEFAKDEARRDTGIVNAEHMLLGLLRVEDALAARILASFDVSANDVRAASKQFAGRSRDEQERILELAQREAVALGSELIETEHILLGLLDDPAGPAARILLALDADADRMRLQVATAAEDGRVSSPREVAGALTVEQIITALREAKEVAITNQDFATAAALRDTERELLALVRRIPQLIRLDTLR